MFGGVVWWRLSIVRNRGSGMNGYQVRNGGVMNGYELPIKVCVQRSCGVSSHVGGPVAKFRDPC